MAICLLGLGSNLGDRAGTLWEAVRRLSDESGVTVRRVSSLVETRPVGGPSDQPRFLNAAALVETTLPPAELLAALRAIEDRLGRVRGERWGPRTIDLDLLLYDRAVIETPELTIPHPRLHERRFVLAPAAEVAPGLVHPVLGRAIGQLLEQLPPASEGELGLRVIATAAQMQAEALALRRAGRRLGLVPTMGALHEGHLSLVRSARERSDVVVATIFVNPTQFGPHEDFANYPRTLEADLQALSAAGCDLVFVPEQNEIYPPGSSTLVEPPAVGQPLEGAFRPGHFRGVATIVLKLFHLIPADAALFGQKDYQQCCVIRHMVRDLNVPIEIVVCPTVREPDGLAMSSRNRYLSPAERKQALALSQALTEAERLMAEGNRDAAQISRAMQAVLAQAGIERIDYATIVDSETLSGLTTIAGPAVALIACYVGNTRLIDNRPF